MFWEWFITVCDNRRDGSIVHSPSFHRNNSVHTVMILVDASRSPQASVSLKSQRLTSNAGATGYKVEIIGGEEEPEEWGGHSRMRDRGNSVSTEESSSDSLNQSDPELRADNWKLTERDEQSLEVSFNCNGIQRNEFPVFLDEIFAF